MQCILAVQQNFPPLFSPIYPLNLFWGFPQPTWADLESVWGMHDEGRGKFHFTNGNPCVNGMSALYTVYNAMHILLYNKNARVPSCYSLLGNRQKALWTTAWQEEVNRQTRWVTEDYQISINLQNQYSSLRDSSKNGNYSSFEAYCLPDRLRPEEP